MVFRFSIGSLALIGRNNRAKIPRRGSDEADDLREMLRGELVPDSVSPIGLAG